MNIIFLETKTLGFDIDLALFGELGEVQFYDTTKKEEIAERVEDADVVIVNKLPMTEETLKNAKQIKLICVTATGTNNIDFDYTNKHGIIVTNVKGYSTSTVVQHTFALFFYLMEHMPYYDNYVKSGLYTKSSIFTHLDKKFYDLAGKTWGIVGLGEIGKGVAKAAEAFGCDVIYYSTSGKNQNPDYKRVSWEELLAQSDVVSVHAPLTLETKELFNQDAFEKMKQTAIFLNLGRGPIVDEAALTKAIKEGQIAGAGLDVLCTEPMAEDSPFRELNSDRLVITPHIAWASVEARERLIHEVYENIVSYQNKIERNIVTG